eukprot:Skav233932  [mRNA]  locus=scaffold2412:1838:4101:- [translate_table: standard]
MQLAMQRRCPSGVPDALAVTIAMLLLVVAALCIEGLCSWWTPDVQLEKKAVWPEKLVHSKPPLKTFTSSLSWFGGFVMSLAALQTGALLVVEKSCDLEVVYLDKFLVVLLVLYGSLVVALVGLKVAVLAVPALAGPCWTLLKGINSGHEMEKLQNLVETDFETLSAVETPKVQVISWTSFLTSCRMGSPDLRSIAPHSAVEEVPATLKLSDLMCEVKGLRPSDPITTYEVRFSPLVTLPVLLQISSGNFTRKVAWSTLPASILSVPEGPGCNINGASHAF